MNITGRCILAKCSGRILPEKHKRTPAKKKIPKSFDGHSLSVSDVLVLNREGEITAYYVEKRRFYRHCRFYPHWLIRGRCLPLKLRIFILKAKQEAGWCWTPDYRRQGIFSYGTYGIRQECCLCDTGCRRENCGGG